MKTPLLKDTFREISKTKGRFFSIFGIVLIGVAFFAGVSSSASIMRYNADKYYDDMNLQDYRIMSNFGITEEDVEKISEIEGIEGILPAYEADVLVSLGSTQSVLRIHSLDLSQLEEDNPNYINQLILVEGRYPQKSGEIVVDAGKMAQTGLNIGDVITISSGTDDDIYDTFSRVKYTVVGKVHSVNYLSYDLGDSDIGSGTVNMFGYISAEDFSQEVYTEVYLTVEGAKQYNSYEDEYFDYIEPVTDALETLGAERADLRREEVLKEAQDKYDEGYQEYLDGVEEFNTQIKEAEETIEESEMELLAGELTLQNQEDLANLKIELAQQDVDQYKSILATLQTELDKLKKEYEESNKDVIEQKNELEESKTELESQLEEAQSTLETEQQNLDELESRNSELTGYEDRVTALTQEVSDLSLEITQLTVDMIGKEEDERNALQAQIDEKTAQIEADRAEIEELNQKISDFNTNNPDLATEITLAQLKVNQAQNEVTTLTTSLEAVDRSLTTVNSTLNSASTVLDEVQKQIDEYNTKMDEAQKEIDEGKKTLETEIAKGKKELEDGQKKLEEGKAELEEKKAEGEAELEDAQEELVKAQAQIDAIAQGKWYILDRNSHYGYRDYLSATERMDAIGYIFPVFFFLVAALVCLTTMTRMVDEQRTQIGTMKALGYSTRMIAFKYVFYAAFASVLGSIIGLIFGSIAFPYVIYTAWNMMYVLPAMKIAFVPKIMILSLISMTMVTTGAAFVACYSELVETPSVLMRPKTPKMGKKILLERIPFIWKRFSFTSKVTARNLFRYKKRFFMTVIGIAGCTALLVTGFGIKDSISDLVSIQFDTVFHYNGTISLHSSLDKNERQELLDEVKQVDGIEDAYLISMTSTTATYKDNEITLTLTVASDMDTFTDFYDLHNRKTEETLTLNSSSAIISEHTATKLGVKVGDVITITNEDGIEGEVEIGGICENYIGHYLFMSPVYYKSIFGVKATDNIILARAVSGQNSEIAATLAKKDGVDTISFFTAVIDNFSNMIVSLNYIVVVLIISSGALAFVVLYNLTNVNISERLREIATLKVLGFHDKEVNAYVYKENIILTFIGALVGTQVGRLLHYSIMVMVELEDVMFGRNINTFSYIISIIITMGFGVLVNMVMKKKLREIPMVESLKSVE